MLSFTADSQALPQRDAPIRISIDAANSSLMDWGYGQVSSAYFPHLIGLEPDAAGLSSIIVRLSLTPQITESFSSLQGSGRELSPRCMPIFLAILVLLQYNACEAYGQDNARKGLDIMYSRPEATKIGLVRVESGPITGKHICNLSKMQLRPLP